MARLAMKAVLVTAALLGMSCVVGAVDSPEASVVFIEVGYMENGAFVKAEEGTGFLVHPGGWVVTAKHVSEAPLPNGKIRFIRGAVKSRTASPYQLFDAPSPVVSSDIALLRFAPNLRSDWSYLKINASHSFKNLDKVTAFGFPNGADIEVRPGVVSNLLGPKGSIGVNVGLAPGMSGGPVILSDTRCVVGIVAGGSEYPSFDYFTPVQYAKPLLEVPPAEFVTEVATAGGAMNEVQAPLFDRSYRIDETKDDHGPTKTSKTYNFDFKADSAAKIVSARFVEESAAAASDKVLNIGADRKEANFKFQLESGPFFDQWRGWWHGQVILTQQRDPEQQQGQGGCE